ncbi:MAG: vWA domain-containing protein [Gemmatimonadota bacterium]
MTHPESSASIPPDPTVPDKSLGASAEELAPSEVAPGVPSADAAAAAAVSATAATDAQLPDVATGADLATPTAAPQQRARTKGVADIVFLIDISGSMAPVIDALRRNIEVFIDSLSGADANNASPVKDWRGKVVGYRDAEHDPDWFHDNPFVRDAVALKAQLADLRAEGGGDEPESLLDALYKIATMETSPKGAQSVEPTRWRYRSEAARVVVVFTDASVRETMAIPEAKGGSLQDVANVVMANRIILSLFAPNFEVYDRLSQIDKSEWEVVEYEGLSAQEALQKYTSDQANFRNTLKQLAASVSKSAETVAL